MKITVIDNNKIKLVDELNSIISKSSQIRMAIAFAKIAGYNLIKESLESFIKEDKKITLLIGLDFRTTDPLILHELFEFTDKKPSFEMYCLTGNQNKIATYHPKIYLFNHLGDNTTAIVGSSNLTKGGLDTNVEINLEIFSDFKNKVFDDLVDAFQQMMVYVTRVKPNREYIDDYEQLYKAAKKKQKIASHPKYKELKELEKILPKPKIAANELAGWLKLVYGYLPESEFATNEMYQYEDIFQKEYPENCHIQEKIRQQLQFLEKLGYLKKTVADRWIKAE